MSSSPPTAHDVEAILAQAKSFYDREYSGEKYMTAEIKKFPELAEFAREFGFDKKGKCLEIGCGRGEHQDCAEDYTGVDISDTSAKFIKPGKKFRQCSATELPFADNTFDGAWTIWVIEHVPGPEKAMEEIRRVMKPGGVVFFGPCWLCRPWAAQGYPVRPYSDFGLKGKLIKASIPLREWIVWRSMFVFPQRLWRMAGMMLNKGPTKFRYGKLKPNFEKYWMPDSDAMNKMDAYEAMMWFKSRGDEIVRPATAMRQFMWRLGPFIVRIRK